jgi:hypothetical protein
MSDDKTTSDIWLFANLCNIYTQELDIIENLNKQPKFADRNWLMNASSLKKNMLRIINHFNDEEPSISYSCKCVLGSLVESLLKRQPMGKYKDASFRPNLWTSVPYGDMPSDAFVDFVSEYSLLCAGFLHWSILFEMEAPPTGEILNGIYAFLQGWPRGGFIVHGFDTNIDMDNIAKYLKITRLDKFICNSADPALIPEFYAAGEALTIFEATNGQWRSPWEPRGNNSPIPSRLSNLGELCIKCLAARDSKARIH